MYNEERFVWAFSCRLLNSSNINFKNKSTR